MEFRKHTWKISLEMQSAHSSEATTLSTENIIVATDAETAHSSTATEAGVDAGHADVCSDEEIKQEPAEQETVDEVTQPGQTIDRAVEEAENLYLKCEAKEEVAIELHPSHVITEDMVIGREVLQWTVSTVQGPPNENIKFIEREHNYCILRPYYYVTRKIRKDPTEPEKICDEVKLDSGREANDPADQEKDDKVTQQGQDSDLAAEEEVMENLYSTREVKEEVARELYPDHVITEEMVIGPEVLQQAVSMVQDAASDFSAVRPRPLYNQCLSSNASKPQNGCEGRESEKSDTSPARGNKRKQVVLHVIPLSGSSSRAVTSGPGPASKRRPHAGSVAAAPTTEPAREVLPRLPDPKPIARLREMSRSRSVTPCPGERGQQSSHRPSAARRALMMGLALERPMPSPPGSPSRQRAMVVNRSPGGSLGVDGAVDVQNTPGGQMRVYKPPLTGTALEVRRSPAIDVGKPPGVAIRLRRLAPKPILQESIQKRLALQAMLRSGSSSRSVTPGPGLASMRRPHEGAVAAAPTTESAREELPRLPDSTPGTALEVQWSPGLFVSGQTVDVKKPPSVAMHRRRLRPKTILQESIHALALERLEAMDLEEEEGDTAAKENYGHVMQWMKGYKVLGYSKPPRLCIKPPPLEKHIDPISGIDRLADTVEAGPSQREVQPEPLSKHNGTQDVSKFASGDGDFRPSTSGTQRTLKRGAPPGSRGSDFDSDFDDEFELEEAAACAVGARDIPDDDELNEIERNLVNTVSRDMDEAVERLVTVSTDFIWQADFDTFGGVPEVFSGPTPGPIDDYNTPYEAFTSIWSRDFIEHIVRETNRYAEQVIDLLAESNKLTDTSRVHRWVETNVDEMYAYLAINILMGLDLRTSVHEYWKVGGLLEVPRFRRVLCYNRFILLNKFIHFVDNFESQDVLRIDGVGVSAKLAKIAPVLVHLNDKFSKLYNLHPDVAIDESLTLFKGRLSWVQAIRTKAARFGIKSYELCESRTGYLWKFEIYTGKNSERGDFVAPSADLAGKTTQVVLDLLKGLEHRGHCVTMDNFYNCPALARHLKSLGFDCLGTLRPNRKHVPVEIAKAPKNVPMGTIVARHSGDVACIAWKDSKMVNMISTYHTDETFVGRKAGRELVKPVVVRDYHSTMGGIDLKEQKLTMYLVERKRCVKWYIKIFRRLLNASVLNAHIMLAESLKRRGMPLITHRTFREELARSLANKHAHSPQEKEAVSDVLRLDKSIAHVPQLTDSRIRGYCHICIRNDIQKIGDLKCVECDEFLCPLECWRIWHTEQQLPGRDVWICRGRRLH